MQEQYQARSAAAGAWQAKSQSNSEMPPDGKAATLALRMSPWISV